VLLLVELMQDGRVVGAMLRDAMASTSCAVPARLSSGVTEPEHCHVEE
jgi:hypothetical protein